MNNKIRTLIEKLNSVKAESQNHIFELDRQLQTEYNKEFSRDKLLSKMVKRLQKSDALELGPNGIYQWISFDVSEYSNCLDYLKAYLDETYCIRIGEHNDSLELDVGPSLTINHRGDVFDEDSGKFAINAHDYKNVSERNALIEAYMEKTGHFPGVYSVDSYSNVTTADTQKKSQK